MRRNGSTRGLAARLAAGGLMLAAIAAWPVAAGEWASWRGPHQTGVSDEKGLVETWSPEGENLVWKADFIGRSTPVVVDGRVCVIGRTDEKKILRQETVACYDAGTGALRWQDRWNVYNTTVPFNRVGWASLAADPETGYVFAQGVAGQLRAYDRDGKLVWSYFLTEDFGRLSGYGGRTQTPVVDGDLLLLSVVNAGWGNQAAPRNRYFAFDKRTGEVIWVSAPGLYPEDMNTQSVPIVVEVDGERLLLNGNADGFIYALRVATGEKVWQFQLSKRGLNSTPVFDGKTLYVSHSEENVDTPTMGRLVAIDPRGRGDITKSNELWRIDELAAGFPSPAYKDGVLYIIDNSANLRAIDASNGKKLWAYELGTVGKASPVVADGKIYATETNGRVHILRLTDDGAEALDSDLVTVADGRYAEIYGSPAVAYGRIYVATEGGLYCIGDKSKPFAATPATRPDRPRTPAPGEGEVAWVQLVPAEVMARPGEEIAFTVRTFDAKGRPLGQRPAEWSLERLSGEWAAPGRLALGAQPFQAGTVTAKVGTLAGQARVRVVGGLPWSYDFEENSTGRAPGHWVSAGRPWEVREVDGNKVLVKVVRDAGLLRGAAFMGPSSLSGYTIQADVYGQKKGRRYPDMGLINRGYILDMQGNQARLEVRSWTSELRMARNIDLPWEVDTWYTIKLRVDDRDGKALILGKVWPRAQPEPEEWTIRVEDPLPIPAGSPGVIAYSPAEVFFDNIKVTVNE